MMLQTDRFHVSLMSRDNCYFDFDWLVKSDIVALSWGDTETQSTFGFPIQSVAFD